MPSHKPNVDVFLLNNRMRHHLIGFQGKKNVYASWTARSEIAKNMKLLDECNEETKADVFMGYMLLHEIYKDIPTAEAMKWIWDNKKEQCNKWVKEMIRFTRQAVGCEPNELRKDDELTVYFEFAELLRGFGKQDPVYFMPPDMRKGFHIWLNLQCNKSKTITLSRPTERRSPDRSNGTYRPTERHTQAPKRCDKATQTD